MAEACALTTIEEFYKFCMGKKLVASKCRKCGALLLPPRPMCPKCYSTGFEAVEFKGYGRLVSYTVIHVAPPRFQKMAPYIVGIVELDEGPRLPGLIRGVSPQELKIGGRMNLKFKARSPKTYPAWCQYYFKPLSRSKDS